MTSLDQSFVQRDAGCGRKDSSRGSFWAGDGGGRGDSDSCLSHPAPQLINRSTDARRAGSSRPRYPWARTSLGCHSGSFFYVAAWVIGGHEIDEVHPGQSETVGSGLEGLIGVQVLAPPGMAPI